MPAPQEKSDRKRVKPRELPFALRYLEEPDNLKQKVKQPKIGRPLKFKTVGQLWSRAVEYLSACLSSSEPITITGLAMACGVTRQGLIEYEDRADFGDAIKRLKLVAEHYAERQLYLSKNPTGPIFALKNFKWTDKTAIDLTGQLTIGRLLDAVDESAKQDGKGD